jgi:RNA polymerase sigma-70 factor (ECF subfamily)
MGHVMSSSPTTRASLLLRIRDPGDRLAWGEFVRVYAPLLHAYGLHRGLQDADAADLAQEVLRRLTGALPEFQYDPSRGSFRGWLFTVTRNELLKMARTRGRQPAGTGESEVRRLLEEQPDTAQDEEYWDREYRWSLFLWAADRVRPEFRDATWQAFWLTAVEGNEVDSVAAKLAISAGAVYIARSRVTARIRDVIQTVDGE